MPVWSAPAIKPDAPMGLLARGVLGPLTETWQAIRTVLSGKVRALPLTPELAVTTLSGFSPLVAGLVDATAPVPLALVRVDSGEVGFVAAVRVTSGSELVVSVSYGADARFVAEVDRAAGVTLLRPKGASGALAVGIAGDYLVLGSTVDHVRAAAGYVATSQNPYIELGELGALVADGSVLGGPVRALIVRGVDGVRRRLEESDAQSRLGHGGREPDFADPKPVVAALGELSDRAARFVSTTSRVRLAASTAEPVPVVRLEIEPAAVGEAHDFLDSVPRGDDSLLRGLPSWVDVSVLWQRSESEGSPFTDRIAALLGARLARADRDRLEKWAGDLDRGLGGTAAIGLYGRGGAAGVFVVGSGGDGKALERATARVVEILRIQALRAPLEAFAGHVTPRVRRKTVDRFHEILVSMRVATVGPTAVEKYEVASASDGHRGAVVIGLGDVETRLFDLLEDRVGSLGADRTLADAAKRHHGDVACAGALRLIVDGGGQAEFVALSAGRSEKSLWMEAEGSGAALLALVSARMQTAGP